MGVGYVVCQIADAERRGLRPIAVCELKRVLCRDPVNALPIRAGKILDQEMVRFHFGQRLPDIALDQPHRAALKVLLPNGEPPEERSSNEWIVIGTQR